jgi:hypothetical protein
MTRYIKAVFKESTLYTFKEAHAIPGKTAELHVYTLKICIISSKTVKTGKSYRNGCLLLVLLDKYITHQQLGLT